VSDIERQLATRKTPYQVAVDQAERLHIENLNLQRANQRLRKALARLIAVVEGAGMTNAIQRGRDLL
jgi:hypothetical protein